MLIVFSCKCIALAQLAAVLLSVLTGSPLYSLPSSLALAPSLSPPAVGRDAAVHRPGDKGISRAVFKGILFSIPPLQKPKPNFAWIQLECIHLIVWDVVKCGAVGG